MRFGITALAVTALLTTGCGTTVAQTGQVQHQLDIAGPGATGTAPGLAPPPTRQDGSTGPVTARGGTGRTTDVVGNVSSAAPVTVSTGPIQIGILTTNTSGFASAGINIGATVSDRQVYQAIVNGLNARGGIGGRRIVPVFAEVGGDNWAVDFEAACQSFTRDHHVSAVLGYAFILMDSFESCLARNGIPHLSASYAPGDLTAQRQYPLLFSTTSPTVDQHLLLPVLGAVDTGLLTAKSKLGIVFDTCNNDQRAFDARVAPYLRSHHVSYDLVVVSCMGGSNGADVGSSVQAVQSAELRFRSSGVDTVYVEGPGAILFMNDAESQAWHPTYLISYGGAGLQGNAPNDQLANVHGFGWLPAVDVDPGHQPARRSPAQVACLALLKAQGITLSGYNDFFGAYTMCDAFALYGQAVEHVRGTVGQDVVAALTRLAGSARVASTYDGVLRATAAQRGGAALWRAYGWVGSCSCFQYRGPSRPMP